MSIKPHRQKIAIADLQQDESGVANAHKTFLFNKNFKVSDKPVDVGQHVTTGKLHLLNGYHRVLAAQKRGETHIEANVVPTKGKYNDRCPDIFDHVPAKWSEMKKAEIADEDLMKMMQVGHVGGGSSSSLVGGAALLNTHPGLRDLANRPEWKQLVDYNSKTQADGGIEEAPAEKDAEEAKKPTPIVRTDAVPANIAEAAKKVMMKGDAGLEKRSSEEHVAHHWQQSEHNVDEQENYSDLLQRHHKGEWRLKLLPVSQIDAHHGGYGKDSDLMVADYAKRKAAGSDFPPIIVKSHPEKEGHFQTIDGQHRLQAAKQMGLSHIRAYVPATDMKKAEEALQKMGAMRRIAPFNPHSVSDEARFHTEDWTGGYGNHDPNAVPQAPKEALARGLHKLHTMTAVRKNPTTGEREFLLHRGMRPTQHDEFTRTGSPGHISSWTPSHVKASQFAEDYLHDEKSDQTQVAHDYKQDYGRDLDFSKPHVHSAWVPESQIHHIPNTIGSRSPDVDNQVWGPETQIQKPHRRGEHEVMVKPHKFQVELDPHKHINMTGAPASLHERIGARKGSEFASTLNTRHNFMKSDPKDKTNPPKPEEGFKQLSEETLEGKKLKAAGAKIAAVKELQQKRPDVDWDQALMFKAEDEPKLPKRHKSGVGKAIGGSIYVHKKYADQVVPAERLKAAKDALPKDHKYTVIKYTPANDSLSFIHSPDFESADEPTVGDSVRVSKDNSIAKRPASADPEIYHHKWLMVPDEHEGFDVKASKKRSSEWMKKPDVDYSRIGRKSHWDEFMKKSEALEKEDYGYMDERRTPVKMHGWISPEGKYHHMPPLEYHDRYLEEKHGLYRDAAYNAGWLSVGHAGHQVFSGDSKITSNPRHPAMMKLKEMAQKHWHTGDIFRTGHMIDTEAFLKHGAVKPALNKSEAEPKYTRNIWHPEKLKEGHELEFEGKKYKVVSQGSAPQDSANFKGHYYTQLLEKSEDLEKMHTIRLPGFEGVSTRPDQEVSSLHTDAQRNLKQKITDHRVGKFAAEDRAQVKGVFDGEKHPRGMTVYPHYAHDKVVEFGNPVAGYDSSLPDTHSTREHEGLHYQLSQVETNHGSHVRRGLVSHLLSHLNEDNHDAIRDYTNLVQPGTQGHPVGKEERLCTVMDIANNPKRRESFDSFVKQRGYKFDHDQHKKDVKSIVAAARAATPDSIRKSEELEKMARPKVGYHGSTMAFEDFKPPTHDTDLNYGPGIYFAKDPKEASEYARPQIWKESDRKAASEVTKTKAFKDGAKRLARKHGLKSTLDTRHPNFGAFSKESRELEDKLVSKKMGYSPNVRKVKIKAKRAFDPHNWEHAQEVARSTGHEFDKEGTFKHFNGRTNPYDTNFYNMMVEHSLGWNEEKRHSDFYGPNADYAERSAKLNDAIQRAGFDHIHDKERGHYIVFKPEHIKDYFSKSEGGDDAYLMAVSVPDAARQALFEVTQDLVNLKLNRAAAMLKSMAEEELEKMSRPAIKLPNFKKLSTRPDQEVQSIETTRQKEIFGRKVAQGRGFGNLDERGSEAKRYVNKFSTTTMGLNANTPRGPKSGAVTGAMMSRFEAGGEEHANKMAEYNQKMTDWENNHLKPWNEKAREIIARHKAAPGWKERMAIHDNEWLPHKASLPKKPRKPTKSKKTSDKLTPEQRADRGRRVDSTIHHEALHHLSETIRTHYGNHAQQKFVSGMMAHYPQETQEAISGFIKGRGYKPSSRHFREEMLTHARDILTDPETRASFQRYHGDKAKAHIQQIKQSHQKSYEWAKNLKPSDIGADTTNYANPIGIRKKK